MKAFFERRRWKKHTKKQNKTEHRWDFGNRGTCRPRSEAAQVKEGKIENLWLCACVFVWRRLLCVALFVFVPFCMGAGSRSLSFALKWWEPTQRERSLWYLEEKNHREVWTQLCDSGPATPTSVYFTPQDSHTVLPKDRNRHITSSCLVCTTTELQLCFVCPHTLSNGNSQTSSQHLCKNNVNFCLWRSPVAHRLEAYDGEGVCTPLDVCNPWQKLWNHRSWRMFVQLFYFVGKKSRSKTTATFWILIDTKRNPEKKLW